MKNSHLKLIETPLLVLFVFIAASCASTPSFKDGKGVVIPGSVAFLDHINIGGVDQFICVRGVSRDNPVLLFLHGGPGSAETPLVRYYDHELEKRFIVVNWDQRGAGKTYSPTIPVETMTIDQFVADAHELVNYLKQKFNKEKIYIVGHSWGSALGVMLVQQYPEDFIAYIGVGQFVNGSDNECLSYEFTLNEAIKRKDGKGIAELTRIGPPVNGLFTKKEDLEIQRKWLDQYGGALWGKSDMIGMYLIGIFGTTEYAGINIFDYFAGVRFSLLALWPAVVQIDLKTSAPELKIPVYFFTGRHDWNTPFPLVQEYFDLLQAPSKQIIWFEKSAHSPAFEEPEKFCEAMFQVLVETSAIPVQ